MRALGTRGIFGCSKNFPIVSKLELGIECLGSVVRTMVAYVLQPWRGNETLLNPFELDSGLLEQLEGSSQDCIGCAAPLGWAVKSASLQSSMSSAVRVSVIRGSEGVDPFEELDELVASGSGDTDSVGVVEGGVKCWPSRGVGKGGGFSLGFLRDIVGLRASSSILVKGM